MITFRNICTLIFLLVGVYACSDSNALNENNSQEFDYNYPEGCCSSKGWMTNFEEYEMNVKLFYPNVFTPNSNSGNNIYYIHTNELIDTIKSFKVFDQGGEEVFESFNFKPNDPSEGWDGLHSGEFVEGAYKAVIEFINPNGTEVSGEIIICVLECHQDLIFHYRAQGMSFDECRWVNQHDGNGNFKPEIAPNECQ